MAAPLTRNGVRKEMIVDLGEGGTQEAARVVCEKRLNQVAVSPVTNQLSLSREEMIFPE